MCAEKNPRAHSPQVTLHCVDCIVGMMELPPASVDVVVTSPPYNLGKNYGAGVCDKLDAVKYLVWTKKWIAEVVRVMAPGASLFLNVSGSPKERWIPHDVANIAGIFLQLQNEIHWVKSIALDAEDIGLEHNLPNGLSVGHYKPINSKRFLNDCHEYVFHFTLSGNVGLDRLAIGVPYADKTNTRRWSGGKDLRCRGNVWFLPYPTIQKGRPHPAVFPVKLPERCIKLHGLKPDMVVLDPFSGIGSTALACVRLGVAFIGFELNAEFAEEAQRRISIEQEVQCCHA